MKIIHLPLIVTGIGVLLVGLSFVWPGMVGPKVWSDEQALHHSQVSADIHSLAHQQPRGTDDEPANGHQAEQARSLQEARQRFQQSQEMLQQAQGYRDGVPRLLRWAGGLCVVLGAAGFFLLRRTRA
jgi:hypothetical protein